MIVKIKVAVLSHPTELVVLYVCVPELVYVVLFQVYVSQAVTDELDVLALFTVKLVVTVESQPLDAVSTSV